MNKAMIDKRTAKMLSLSDTAKLCYCSPKLLWILEYGDGITHPNIASRIAKVYGLTVDEFNRIVSEAHHVSELPKFTPPPKDKVNVYELSRRNFGV